jgi:6-phosphofructo-2-kinase
MTANAAEDRKPNGVSLNGNSNNSARDPARTPQKTVVGRALGNELSSDAHRPSQGSKDGVGCALTDTPISTAPPSPQMYVSSDV